MNPFHRKEEAKLPLKLAEVLPYFNKPLNYNTLNSVIVLLLTHLTLEQLTYVVNSINEERTKRYADAA